MTNQFDAIVVGSGITGGWAAKELTEAGLRVLLLERGRHVEHGKDYITEHKAPWEMPYRGVGDTRLFDEDYPIQSKNFVFGEYSQHFFVNDREAPYISESKEPFHWIRGYQLGGRSLTWGRHCYRLSEMDFTANKLDGNGVDWPIRYAELAPWYDYVEDFIGVSGQAEQLEQLPDGKFLPPMEYNCVERHFKDSVEEKYRDRRVTMGRVAVLTRPHRGRASCHYCGPCDRGCSAGAYFSTQSSTLPAARKTGNLTLVTDAVVERLSYDAASNRISGVEVIDSNTLSRRRYSAKMVFLCASTLGSTQILLNSKNSAFPSGLANSSGQLGHNLMDHGFVPAAVAMFPAFEDSYYQGNRPNSLYIPRFQNLDGRGTDFLRGYGYQGLAWRAGWQRENSSELFGEALKERLRAPGPWMMMLGGMVECLPSYGNRVTLDESRPDKWGIPQLRIRFEYGENEQKLADHASREAAAMLQTAGGVVVMQNNRMEAGGLAVHEMGTVRMGRDPKTSVLNGHNQAHDVPNLFVTDGAAMTSSACQNPSLTYMALTARACRYAATQLAEGTL